LKSVKSSLSDKYHLIFCVAGGWSGGSIKDKNLLDVYDEMHSKNVIPAITSNTHPYLK
jgi:dihydropteridine reductase